MLPFNYKVSQKFNNPDSYGLDKPHEGLDLNLKGTWGNQDCGTEIRCIYPGKVIHSFDGKYNYGNLVVVECDTPNGKRWVRYCHLSERVVTSGLVKRGDLIGKMGSTGNSTACHLHLDVFKKKPNNWRSYYKDVPTWYEDPLLLINSDIILDEVADYLQVLLKDQLGIDVSASEGDVRGRVGEIKDKLNSYESLKKQVTKLEKNYAQAAGEAAEYETRLSTVEQGRDRVEKELEEVKRVVSNREAELADLKAEVETLKQNLDPKKFVLVPVPEYERLQKKRQLDRATRTELLSEFIKRSLPDFKKIIEWTKKQWRGGA